MSSELFNLTGKRALVTGSSRGIGFAIAKGLAQHGADLVLMARSTEALQAKREEIANATGRDVRICVYDLEKSEGIPKVFAKTVEETGSVDILVNCAGTTIRDPAEEVTLETWQRVHDINLTSAMRLSQAFCQNRRLHQGEGRILNVTSVACYGARPTTAAYASSKNGLLALTRAMAVEWAKYHISVNALAPGYIATELTEPLWRDEAFDQWVVSKTPMARWGRPEDLVGAAVLLASPAGAFITGQTITVDGGWLALL